MRARRFVLLLVIASIGLVGCSDDDDSDEDAVDAGSGSGTTTTAAPAAGGLDDRARMSIMDFSFSPKQMTVNVGAEIPVQNLGQAAHTFTSEDAGFDVELDGGDSGVAEVKTTTPGTYDFVCRRHATMTGQITVEAA